MARKQRICLVTTGHLSTNPRIVKEADALHGAGYEVTVIACKYLSWANEADREFDDRAWSVVWCRYGAYGSPLQRFWLRIRRRLFRALLPVFGFRDFIVRRAFHYVIPELTRIATSVNANLFVGHNLAALPAAVKAARRHRAKLGFDAEDFHRGELNPNESNARTIRLTEWIEDRYMPECDYLTAASDGIAAAYADALSVVRPTTILNVFPLSDLDVRLSPTQIVDEKEEGHRSLYWFSQSIGGARGLEDAVDALGILESEYHLYLRGTWRPGYEDELMNRARSLGVEDRVHVLPPVPPAELVRRASQHDIGLALEPGVTRNSQILCSNKVYTYLLGGIPVIATSTESQKRIFEENPEVIRLYRPGNISELVLAVRNLCESRDAYLSIRRNAEHLGLTRYNWDTEKEKLTATISNVLSIDS